MPSLADFQQRFASAALGRQSPEAPFGSPAFAIYRNTWVKALLDALDANYPTVAMLLGAKLFESLAAGYVRGHPAATPALAFYGEGFPEFLARQEAARDIPYLRDVASLDRLWTEALFAPDAPFFEAQAAASLAPHELLELRPRLHPAARLAWFETPAVTIWQAHRQAEAFEELEPAWRGEGALVVRRGASVEVRAVDESSYAFLQELRHGVRFGVAAERAGTRFPSMDWAKVFAEVLASGALQLPASKGTG